MEHAEKRKYLIKTLLAEEPEYSDMEIPSEPGEQKRLLRSLFNVRMPGKISEDFLKVQDGIAFCCISTGVFMFPNEKAAQIAVRTVKEYRMEHGSGIEVIF